MKPLYCIVLFFIFTSTLFCDGTPPDGAGSQSDPYQIQTVDHLIWLCTHPNEWDEWYMQTSDIDIASSGYWGNSGFIPIGNDDTPFTGGYIGNYYAITNLYMYRYDDDYCGMFGKVSNATLKQINIPNANINTQSRTGCLAGSAWDAFIENCTVSGTINVAHNPENLNSLTGGLVGEFICTGIRPDYRIESCSADVVIQATGSLTGGLIGFCYATMSGFPFGTMSITNSFAMGNVQGEAFVGGLIGSIDGGGSGYLYVTDCYTLAHVSGTSNCGGFAGEHDFGLVQNCFWGIDESGQTSSAAGTGKSMYQMMHYETYDEAGWDFVDDDNGDQDAWKMSPWVNGGYPFHYYIDAGNNPPTELTGEGTTSSPYHLYDLVDLYFLSTHPDLWSSFIEIRNSMNASMTASMHFGQGLMPLGTNDTPFTGTMNGRARAISNLTINRPNSEDIGLFGCTSDAYIYDVILEDVQITGQARVGGLVGRNYNTDIHRSLVTGSITSSHQSTNSNAYAGGLAGRSTAHEGQTSNFIECFTNVVINADGDKVGGLTGLCLSGYPSNTTGTIDIIDCYAMGSIQGGNVVGGLVGTIPDYGGTLGDVMIENCYSTVEINATGASGGLIAERDHGTVSACFWNTETSGQSYSQGGTGITSEDMRDYYTWFNAGWDFPGEDTNGTDDEWSIFPNYNDGFPTLSWQGYNHTVLIEPQGSGTVANPYLVECVRNLLWISNEVSWGRLPSGTRFLQINDIDLLEVEDWFDGDGFPPIGEVYIHPFDGIYDGAGYRISNLRIQRAGQDEIGLFGFIEYAVLKNICLENIEITGGSNVGGLAGKCNNSDIQNCSVTGMITAIGEPLPSCIGGMIGYMSASSTISSCYTDVYMNTSQYQSTFKVGGLVGYLTNSSNGIIKNSYARGDVDSHSNAGGLIGCNETGIPIRHCYSTGLVDADLYAGGLIGSATNPNIVACFWDIDSAQISTSDGGTGLSTTEMKQISTFLDAGWDFMGEEENGTSEYWGMSQDEENNDGYPMLGWQDFEPSFSSPPDGDGTSDNPYLVDHLFHLMWISENPDSWDCDFLQVSDINAAGTSQINGTSGFLPIANSSSPFTGSYDGDGYRIENIYINRPNIDHVALFGFTDHANLQDIHLIDADITGQARVGTLAGAAHFTNVQDCSATGDVTADHQTVNDNSYAGGLIGSYVSHDNFSASITNSYASVNVVANGHAAGGLIGLIVSGYLETPGGDVLISDCYAQGSVAAHNQVGGMIGRIPAWANTPGTIEIINCFSTASVTGENTLGGLIADRGIGTVTSSFWDTEVSGMESSDGGIGKTTQEMKNANTYLDAGWDFMDETENGTQQIWGISILVNNGYPFLSWQGYDNLLDTTPSGDGTPEDPYQIADALNLCWISVNSQAWDAHYIQIQSIDASASQDWFNGMGFQPIGRNDDRFTGSYNGQGYDITGLHINRPEEEHIGLFGFTAGANISNVNLVNCSLVANSTCGCLIAQKRNGDVTECSATGTITVSSNESGNSYAGGLIGRNEAFESESSDIIGCFTNVDINATGNYVGGLAGNVRAGYSGYTGGTILIGDCYAMGDVSGNEKVGGLAGNQDGTATGTISVENCYSKGHVTGNDDTGGLFGWNTHGTVSACFWDTQTSAQDTSDGGTGLSSDEMISIETYTDAGWDFQEEDVNGTQEIWGMNFWENEGYPFLSWQGYTHFPAKQPDGSGTEESPYLLANIHHLAWIMVHESTWDDHLLQVDDIDAANTSDWYNGEGFNPIGRSASFSGVFNGDGYSINNLYINRSGYLGAGLFYKLHGAVISDVHLIDADVRGYQVMGTLVGYCQNSTVSKCSATGDVTMLNSSGFTSAGGLIGTLYGTDNQTGILDQCCVDVHVSRQSGSNITIVGGMVGTITAGSSSGWSYTNGTVQVTDCYSRGNVSGDYVVAGFAGKVEELTGSSHVQITNCYSTGFVDGYSNEGGFIGFNPDSAAIQASFWDIYSSNQNTSAGGIGLGTNQMTSASTYISYGWDFTGETENGTEDIWFIDSEYNNGYPFLEWEPYIPSSLEPPQDVVVSTDSTHVTIIWSPVVYATSYKIFSCTTPDGEFVEDMTGTFEDETWYAPLPGGRRFYYVKALLDTGQRNTIFQRQGSRARKR